MPARSPSPSDRMRTLTLQVSESSYQVLARDAKERRLKGPEDIAQAAVEDHVRNSVLLDRRFRDAAAEVDRRLARGGHAGEIRHTDAAA